MKPADCLDRAILIQTSEHHDQIRAAFKNDKELRAPLKKKYKGGEFGENIYCSGGDADTLCIGDVLTLVPAARKSGRAAASDSPRGASNNGTLTLQVSNPRRPCSKVDLAYGKTFGGDGVERIARAQDVRASLSACSSRAHSSMVRSCRLSSGHTLNGH